MSSLVKKKKKHIISHFQNKYTFKNSSHNLTFRNNPNQLKELINHLHNSPLNFQSYLPLFTPSRKNLNPILMETSNKDLSKETQPGSRAIWSPWAIKRSTKYEIKPEEE